MIPTAPDTTTLYYTLAKQHRTAITEGDFELAKTIGAKLRLIESGEPTETLQPLQQTS